MKVNGNGQAKILTQDELTQLFSEGLTTARDRALFSILLYTGCRVSEALSLTTGDIQGSMITFRKSTTKGKVATRSVPIHTELAALLAEYIPTPGALFPGRHGRGLMTRAGADLILREACDRIGLQGVSTHSFRRTALTNLSNANIPLRVIQQVSGHSSLVTLQRYLEVKPAQVHEAIAALSF